MTRGKGWGGEYCNQDVKAGYFMCVCVGGGGGGRLGIHSMFVTLVLG